MKSSLVFVLALLSLLVSATARADKAPAGYVVDIELAGADKDAGTTILREGKELPPKLMMPLFSGDVIFLRDAGSRLAVELGGGETMALGGEIMRFSVDGEIATGDDAWSLISSIGGVLAGSGGETPENMASKGDDDALTVPLAMRGPNLVARGERNLWLAWQGGKGPFTLTLKMGAREAAIGPVSAREADVPLPADAGDRFSVTIRDAGNQVASLRFRFRDEAPSLPENLKAAAAGPSAGTLLSAAWLATLDDGAWTVEAAQKLHAAAATDKAAAALLARMAGGWKPE